MTLYPETNKMNMKPVRALTACMALALAAQVSAGSTPFDPRSTVTHPPVAGAAETVVLSPATLGTVTGAINWAKIGCWTTVVAVGVSASAASGGAAAAASIALAGVCLVLF